MATKKPRPARKSTPAKKAKQDRRPRGRPARTDRALSEARVLAAARKLLARNGLKGFSMRGLAAGLKVDPMALYHYFPDRESLLRAASLDYYGSFQLTFRGQRSWQARLERLAEAYLDFLNDAVDVLLFLTSDRSGGAAAAGMLLPLFEEAVRGLELSATQRRDFSSLFFDFLHGSALARMGPADRKIWRGELKFLIAGAAALATKTD